MEIIKPLPHIRSLDLVMCFGCHVDELYGFSIDHKQNAAMLQCVHQYVQIASLTVSFTGDWSIPHAKGR